MASSDLEAALDGLIAATNYAEAIGEDDLAVAIGELYQRLARASPDEHWDAPDSVSTEDGEGSFTLYQTNDDGAADDLAGEGYWHLEQMNPTFWYFGVDVGDDVLHKFKIVADSPISVEQYEGEPDSNAE